MLKVLSSQESSTARLVVPDAYSGIVDNEIPVTDVHCDSRKAETGTLFCCVRGERQNGESFAVEATKRGAVAILADHCTEAEVPHFIVDDVREVMGKAAAFVYGHPAEKMKMIAVTGTNGKTTSAYMLRSLMQASGEKTGMLGTVVYDNGNEAFDADRTTPESPDIQRMLHRMVINGCGACVMEASSHGLAQHRLDGCLFDKGLLTNITCEHLDFHGSMERYAEAKSQLPLRYMKDSGFPSVAVNGDTEEGKTWKKRFGDMVITYGVGSGCAVRGELKRMDLSGMDFDLLLPESRSAVPISIPITGSFNLFNALGAASTGYMCGMGPEQIRAGLEAAPQIPGRVQAIPLPNGATAIVDYAHTPDALSNLLAAVRAGVSGRILLVFGHGGERFRDHRPALGAVASGMADEIVITMDNPRSEDPAEIAGQIAAGITDAEIARHTILDREEAIRFALSISTPGDAVLVAGKGPEKYIIVGDEQFPHDDSEAIRRWIAERGSLE